MAETTVHLPFTYIAGTVRGAFDEFEATVPGARGFRCRACKKAYVVSNERELPAHDCTGTYDRNEPATTAL